MVEYDIKYDIKIGEGLLSHGEYTCDEDEMRKFVSKMREEYGGCINFSIKKVGA